jgi:hypothetical protein
MLRKLYSLVSGATSADNPDSPQHHEVLLPGFLYGMIIKERFEECLNGVKAQITQDMRQKKDKPFTDRKLCFIPAPTSIRHRPISKLIGASILPKSFFHLLFKSPRRREDIHVLRIPQVAERQSCPPSPQNTILTNRADKQPNTSIQS